VSERAIAREAKLAVEGLRQRKKRLMRRLISDTATEMFLDRGFDDVKVTDVAAACGVSEKTVYNYFPTKESLLLDREEDMAVAIRQAFGPGAPPRSPIEAAVAVLTRDLEEMRAWWQSDGQKPSGLARFRRFTDLIDSTPSLRAAQRDMMDRLVQVTAEAMASRAGLSPDDPEPQIAAHAILGLWRIQYHAVQRYADGHQSPDDVFAKVTAEVRRAARLIDSGLWSFGAMVQGGNSREQLKAAADAAQQAGRQVATALRQARSVWRHLQQEKDSNEHRDRHQQARGALRQQQERRREAQQQQWDRQAGRPHRIRDA
jgi:AcrR family transcriptional regulator